MALWSAECCKECDIYYLAKKQRNEEPLEKSHFCVFWFGFDIFRFSSTTIDTDTGSVATAHKYTYNNNHIR